MNDWVTARSGEKTSNTQAVEDAIKLLHRVSKHIDRDDCKCCKEALEK